MHHAKLHLRKVRYINYKNKLRVQVTVIIIKSPLCTYPCIVIPHTLSNCITPGPTLRLLITSPLFRNPLQIRSIKAGVFVRVTKIEKLFDSLVDADEIVEGTQCSGDTCLYLELIC